MSRFYDLLRDSLLQDAKATNNRHEESSGRTRPLSVETTPNTPEGFATIDCSVPTEGRLVGCSLNGNPGAEKFRYLRYRLDRLRRERPLSKVLVTSAIPKEGKTVVAVNLALSLARNSSRVVLVDADMRQPAVHSALGLDSLPGLAEFLQGTLEAPACVKYLDPAGLCYLPAGNASSNPFELLQGPRIQEIGRWLTSVFDWVVIDSPPLIPFADSHCLATFADTALLVVRQGLTSRKSFENALAALDGVNVAGLVLNASDSTQHDGYYHYYYKHQAPPPDQKGTGQ